MLSKFYNLYPYLGIERIENPELKDIFPNADINVKEVKCLHLISDDDTYIIDRMDSFEYSNDINKEKVCYIIRNGTASIVFPSLIIKPDEIDKMKRALWSYFRNEEVKGCKEIENFETFITKNINTIFEMFDGEKDNFIFTFNIDGEYVYTSPLFENSRIKFLNEYNNPESSLTNKTFGQCHLCKENKTIGNFDIDKMNFYAFKTYCTANFNLIDRHDLHNKICGKCFKKLNKSYSMINDDKRHNFIHSFLGYKYMIIPEFIIDSDENEEVMKYFLEKDYALNKYTNEYKRLNAKSERELLYAISEGGLKVIYNMIFYEATNAQFQIFDSVMGIYPEMFKKIFDSKEEVELMDSFEDKEIDMFDLKRLFTDISDKHIISTIVKIFRGSNIDAKWFKREIIKTISNTFKKGYRLDNIVDMAMMWLIWLNKMDILKNKKEVMKMTKELDLTFNEYYERETEQFIDSNDLKLAFLMGVLYEHIAKVQYANLENVPFNKKLNGLNLSYKKLKSLYVDMENKLMQYKVHSRFVYLLTEDIATLFNSLKDVNADNEDLSLAFVIGKRSYDKIKKVYENKIKEEVEENDKE